MPNPQGFLPGDFLVFQIESGFGLLRVLAVDELDDDAVWHIVVYRELFPEIELAESMIRSDSSLTPEIPHIALTDRAFESTQVSKLAHAPLSEEEMDRISRWDGQRSDRSIRLLLGLR